MKITFPECQFDLTIEEYLILLDRETKGYTMTMKFPLPGEKAEVSAHVPAPVPYPSQEEPERIPEPPVFKFPPEDEEPEPEPKPNPEENETLPPIISDAMRRFFEFQEKRLENKLTEQSRQRIIDCENTLEEAINREDILSVKCALVCLDEAWIQAERIEPLSGESPSPEQPQYEPGDNVTEPNTNKPKSGGNHKKKVDVLIDGKWVTFDSAAEAANALGINYKTFYSRLNKNKACNGHEVRYHNEELDSILAEREAKNHQPYQTSRKP